MYYLYHLYHLGLDIWVVNEFFELKFHVWPWTFEWPSEGAIGRNIIMSSFTIQNQYVWKIKQKVERPELHHRNEIIYWVLWDS